MYVCVSVTKIQNFQSSFKKGSFRYPLDMEGVYAPGGPAFLAHALQKVINIVGLTALRLAFFMVYD